MRIPETMRVARLHGWGDVRVGEMAVPRPGPGEALLRVEACGVCGSDALEWYVETKAPAVLGHEPAGTIVAVGEGVTTLRPGDRVFTHHHAPCMACAECRRRLWSNCATWKRSQLTPGGFAEYTRIGAESVEHDTLVLPDRMDFETATFIEPLATCIRALRRQGRLESGDAVLIIGLGPMGQLLTSLARVLGAATVLGSEFHPGRRDRALRRGADAAFDPGRTDLAAAVREHTAGRGADVVVVCPGDPAAIQAGIDAAAPGGRVVGFTPLRPETRPAIDLATLYFREITLTHSYSCGPDETRDALQLLASHDIEVRSLITHRDGLDGVQDAIRRAATDRSAMKSLILPHDSPRERSRSGSIDPALDRSVSTS